MKNLTTKIGLSVAAVLLMFACGGNSNKNNNGETYTLEYNFQEGDVLKQTMSIESKSTQELPQQKMDSKLLVSMGMIFEVKSIENDVYVMNVQYNSVKMDMEMMGVSISFDSNTAEEKATEQDMSPVFKAMTGVQMEMKIDRQGNVQSVTGFEKIHQNMADATSLLDEETRNSIINDLEKQFSESTLQGSFKQISSFMPKTPVAIDDEWKVDINGDALGMGSDIKTKLTMKLISVADNIATLEGKGSVESDVHNDGSHVTLKGEQTITMQIDLNTGWTINSTGTQNLKGKNEYMGMKYPMTTVNITKITNE
ncbi:MAG: DUF6263 family protein [Prevotellaceae bacterium]|jgi:hypothetical protein|nr:DUF6263 family protein [Prevotellaceae bacterium]